MIKAGRVSVNGQTVTDLAYMVDETKDEVRLDGKPISPTKHVYYMLNKPKGVISAVSTPFDETTVVDLIPEEKARVFPVGRLDKDTEGLIFLTNDGDFSYKLTHPSFEKEKVYECTVSGKVTAKGLASLRDGIMLSDGTKLAGADVRLARGRKEGRQFVYEITLREGKNREVRKMFEAVGAKVISLKRISEGGIGLGSLSVGGYRPLSQKEVNWLMSENNRGKRSSGSRFASEPKSSLPRGRQNRNANSRAHQGSLRAGKGSSPSYSRDNRTQSGYKQRQTNANRQTSAANSARRDAGSARSIKYSGQEANRQPSGEKSARIEGRKAGNTTSQPASRPYTTGNASRTAKPQSGRARKPASQSHASQSRGKSESAKRQTDSTSQAKYGAKKNANGRQTNEAKSSDNRQRVGKAVPNPKGISKHPR